MKKLTVILVLIFLILGLIAVFTWETVCVNKDAQWRDGLIYLPNTTKPFTGKNLCKYENGQLSSKGKVVDGKLDGKWTYWYENGKIMSLKNYKDGECTNCVN